MPKQNSKIYDLYLSAKGIALYHKMLKYSQYWTVDELVDFQIEKLRHILVNAYEKTQYYHKLFLECNFNPYKDFHNIGDIQRIPILKQCTARSNKDQLVAETQLGKGIELRTSGTTGEPFIVFSSPEHWVMEQGIVWRHWKWMGYKVRDRMAILRSYVPRDGEPLWKYEMTRNFMFMSAYHISQDNIKLYVKKLREWKPRFIRGYPSSLYLLAKLMKVNTLTIEPLKAILTASETLLPQYREVIEESFGAPVFDWYGLAEPAITMCECQAHKGLHINMEYGLCELVEDASLPADQRRIVATSLHNDVMPLIRYETKDIAIVDSKDVCSCGRKLPLVKQIIGRSDDFLYGSKGRILPSINFYTLFYEFPELTRFQIVQNSVDQIEIRISHQNVLTQNRRSELLKELQSRIGSGVKVELLENDVFVQTGEGKTPVIIQKVKDIKI